MADRHHLFEERDGRAVFSNTALKPQGPLVRRRLAQLLIKSKGRGMGPAMEAFAREVERNHRATSSPEAAAPGRDAIRNAAGATLRDQSGA